MIVTRLFDSPNDLSWPKALSVDSPENKLHVQNVKKIIVASNLAKNNLRLPSSLSSSAAGLTLGHFMYCIEHVSLRWSMSGMLTWKKKNVETFYTARAFHVMEYVKSQYLCQLRRPLLIHSDPKNVLTGKNAAFLSAWIVKQPRKVCWLIVPRRSHIHLTGDSSKLFRAIQSTVRHIFNYSLPQIAFKPVAPNCFRLGFAMKC